MFVEYCNCTSDWEHFKSREYEQGNGIAAKLWPCIHMARSDTLGIADGAFGSVSSLKLWIWPNRIHLAT